MLGWSIMARACRSASKRAMTCRVSMPGLMTLRATLRWTGRVCSAMKTVPMPPSPICCNSLYGPITVPGRSLAAGASTVASDRKRDMRCRRRPPAFPLRISPALSGVASFSARRSGTGFPRKLPACSWDAEQRLDPLPQRRIAAAGFIQVGGPLGQGVLRPALP